MMDWISRTDHFRNATLYLADCREILPDLKDSVDGVVTDPPYGIRYKTRRRRKMATPDVLANDSDLAIWSVPLMVDACKDGGGLYMCTTFSVMAEWQRALREAGAKLKTPIVWDKGNCTSGDLTGDYGNQCEIILFASKGRHLLKGGRPRNLWHIPREPAGEHPTPKPVALMERCIHNSFAPGMTVIDPFMGTGTTGVAAIRQGCEFIGIEIDPKYYEIACERISRESNVTQLKMNLEEGK